MIIRNLGMLVALSLAASAQFPPAWAQDSASQQVDGSHPRSGAGVEYASQCALNGLRCTLVYGDVPANEPASKTTSSPRAKPLTMPRGPAIGGPLAVVIVIVGLLAAIGLWMRFGNGGMLLASAPRDVKRRGEAPESWRTSLPEAEERPGDFLQRIGAMADRRQAVVLLLRHCLVHAADITGTRLFRSDTERAVFARLPQDMPERDRLENFLTAVELVHYGGRTLAENHFGTLFATARGLLSTGRLADA
ncbi:hypothetical protein [Rhizobium binae]|uniref:hypothetical protein n=1 Tax=Rhizobium binae TaxID=1138190 RepID=UPI001C82B835|nr:hypothetical protein [Rhizobium binae]MBX4940608.1 hypothetical protein [Rhizobium binae]MBX4947137.1 hypothetical protein [Rhizobium binae]MBX4949262.1 hypothetical protein [Rhizobium binae]MBX4960266.1 hypothetical protein [Rhizobium binae]MBX4983031.1 hypothetical protein [Rhizobium binae]